MSFTPKPTAAAILSCDFGSWQCKNKANFRWIRGRMGTGDFEANIGFIDGYNFPAPYIPIQDANLKNITDLGMQHAPYVLRAPTG